MKIKNCQSCLHNQEKKAWKAVRCPKVAFEELSDAIKKAITAGELECYEYTPLEQQRKS